VKALIPRGSFNAHWFSLFGAGTVQIMTGAPIFIYAKSLGASSAVLGVIAAFSPLMSVFQLPAARHLGRHGYRRFTMMGWSTRAALILVIAMTPFMTFLDHSSRLAALLALLFFLGVLRGIFSAAWMPWITHLIPEHMRGRFLSIDQFFMYGGSLASLLASALLISGTADPWEYSLIFLLAAAGGVVTLFFFKRTPDAMAGEAMRLGSKVVPWREILTHAPFRELVIMNVVYSMVIGSLGVFTVEYLHDFSDIDVRGVLYLSAFSFAGSLVALPFCGGIVDTTGSKPLMLVANGMLGIVIAGWGLIAADVLPPSHLLVAALNFLIGAASANFNLANVHITMATMPAIGRNYFFALFAVITSFGLGVAPVAWGILLDALGSYESAMGIFHWKRHSIYFFGLLALNVLVSAYIPRLHESPAAKGGASSLIYARLKRSPRFWHR